MVDFMLDVIQHNLKIFKELFNFFTFFYLRFVNHILITASAPEIIH